MQRINAISAMVAGVMTLAICMLIIAQILARALGIVLPGADEFAIASFVAAVFLGLPYTMATDGHVRADVIVSMLPPALQRFAEILVHLVALAFVAYFAWYAAGLVSNSWARNAKFQGLLGSPLWIPQSTMVIGLLLLELTLLHSLVGILRRRSEAMPARAALREITE